MKWLSAFTQSPDGLLHDDPEHRLPPSGDDPPPSKRKTTCEFCECSLTPAGDVLTVSDKAKRFRKHDETIEKHVARIAELETEVRELRTKLTEVATVRESAFDLHL